jgi:hypothetical protein
LEAGFCFPVEVNRENKTENLSAVILVELVTDAQSSETFKLKLDIFTTINNSC